ncbi:glycosyl transferase family 2 [mine drainage metagenome]|uniref:Glycosyl transferase family 2 n=1 Tax=mine drainage metagenome TaxID=410659 RepID=T1D5A5_9ZZZZ
MLSIILPAKNEAPALAGLLPRLRVAQPAAEILVIDDGSTDDTRALCAQHGVTCLSSPYSMGNGAAIKRGARAARGDLLVFMDGDGQHDPADIARLLARLDQATTWSSARAPGPVRPGSGAAWPTASTTAWPVG